MILYPTRHQVPLMAWQAIVHGVTGLVWWGLYDPPQASLWNDIAAVTTEITQHQPDLSVTPKRTNIPVKYHDTGHSLDKGLEQAMRGRGLSRSKCG